MRAFLSYFRSLALPFALSVSLAAPTAKAQIIEAELFQTADASQVVAMPEGGLLVLSDASFLDGEPVFNGSGIVGLAPDGTPLPAWGLNVRFVRALARDPNDGSILIGGYFSAVNTPEGPQPRAGIARRSPDGALTPWSIAPDVGESPLTGVVRIVVLGNGDLIFVDVPNWGPARVCRAAAQASVFRCIHEVWGTVHVLEALPDHSILLGGTIADLGGTPVPPLVRLLPGTLERDESFAYPDTAAITAAAVDGSHVWVASGNHLRRVDANGEAAPGVELQANGSIDTLRADGAGAVFAGGAFSTIGDVPRPGLARVLEAGAVDPLWQPPGMQGRVRDLALQGDRLLAAGPLHSRPARAVGLIALDRVSGSQIPDAVLPLLGLAPDFELLASAGTPDGGAIFAGSFSHDGNQVLPGLLKIDASGELVPGWTAELPGQVTAMLVGPDGQLYMSLRSGDTPFTSRYSLRRLALNDAALDSHWTLPLFNLNPTALMIDDGHLWVGYVEGFSGTSSRLLRVSLGAEATLDPGWNSPVSVGGIARRLIAMPGGGVLMLPQPPPTTIIIGPGLPIPAGPRLAIFSEEPGVGVHVQPFGPEFASGTSVSDVARLADDSLLVMQQSGLGTSGPRRLLANGSLDPDFSVNLGELLPRGSIALDEARGQLYFAANRPDPDFPGLRIPTIARIGLASATVDTGWPAPESQPEVDVQLSVQGARVFAGALRLSPFRPLGAFISTSVPPLFVDGFEGD